MQRKNSAPRAAKVYEPEDLIPQVEAIALLVSGDGRTYAADRNRKQRIRQRILVATSKGDLVAKMWRSEKCYVFGRIAAWAQDEWPGKYGDLPALRDPGANELRGVLTRLTGRGLSYPVPDTLSECQEQLNLVWAEVFSLREQLILAREEVNRLRPDAQAWQRLRAVNRANAKLPRPR